ncbi:MAG: hypothetical protein WCC50_02955 [Pseudolabrys sp.]
MRTFVLIPISALTAASGVAAAYDTARAQTALPQRYVPYYQPWRGSTGSQTYIGRYSPRRYYQRLCD